MNNRNIFLLAGAGLLMTACSSEEPQMTPGAGYQDGLVSFTLETPSSFATRAVNDGLSATQLDYAVFETDGTFLFQQTAVATLVDKQTTVQIPLVNNKTYKVAFVATNEDAPYSIVDGKFVIDYASAKANDDIYDAFYAAKEVTVSPTMAVQTITLYRPFAQVNFAATDWETAKTAGNAISQSGITFSAQAYSTMNLADGSLEGSPAGVEFAINTLPDYDTAGELAADITVAGNTYKHVGMAYVLAPPAPDTDMFTNVTYTYEGPSGSTSLNVTSVPVKRNHRTNIVGAFFTTQSQFEILVDEQFDDPDFDLPYVAVSTSAGLAAALENISEGDQLNLASGSFDIAATSTFADNVMIAGQGVDQTTLVVQPTAESPQAGLQITSEGVTLSNMYIDGTAVQSAGYSHAINVTKSGVEITDCKIRGGGWTTWSSTVLVQHLQEGDIFTISGCDIAGAFRGVLAESQKGSIYVDNCDIDAVYPINVDGSGNGGLFVTNSRLHGWTSYSKLGQGAHFTDCSFSKANSGYNIVAAYCDTEFVNCEFSSDFLVYAQVAGFTFTFTNCTRNGVAITPENAKALLANDDDLQIWESCTVIVNGTVIS